MEPLMTIPDRDEVLLSLCKLSDNQFEGRAKERLKLMVGRPHEEVAPELRGVIADTQYASWSSSFELHVMSIILENIGGQYDDPVFHELADLHYKTDRIPQETERMLELNKLYKSDCIGV